MTHLNVVMVASLGYSLVDMLDKWEGFSGCRQPVHVWLGGSYVFIVVSRLVAIAGTQLSSMRASSWGGDDFLLDLRQKRPMLRFLTSATWMVLVPFFVLWTVIGTVWILEVRQSSPECLDDDIHAWFLYVWQALSYAWIVIHCGVGGVAWFMESRIRGAEADLRQIENEDDDVQSRWGQVSRIQDYSSLSTLVKPGQCLTPAQIRELPHFQLVAGDVLSRGNEECSVCLSVLNTGDCVRRLGGCGHTFHRSCIDLWLLRSADCPLCKGKVTPEVRAHTAPVRNSCVA